VPSSTASRLPAALLAAVLAVAAALAFVATRENPGPAKAQDRVSLAAAGDCADVQVIFARGTGERPGLGILGGPLVRALSQELAGQTVGSTAVDYAAAASQRSAGPGATEMTRQLTAQAADCPGTRFVIGGYSQGATVTDIALGIRTGTSRGTAIPANLRDRVAAVVVFGNPLGIGGRTIAGSAPEFADRAIEFCNRGDIFCTGRGSIGPHLAYRTDGSIAEGAEFAAAQVRDS
jgi:cutinase